MMKSEEIRRAYRGEWLAIAVAKERRGGPMEGELVYPARDRDEVWNKVRGDRRKIYGTYAGPMVEEGYAVAFFDAARLTPGASA